MGPSAISRQRQGKKANESYGAGCVVQKANESYGAGCVVQKANESYGAGCMVISIRASSCSKYSTETSSLSLQFASMAPLSNYAGCQGLDLDFSLSTDGL
ncbi:hypothetical protein VE01_01811 [Pseudogymnoascus verrucosus]|uniref:Uncharacterized protein n=1 Tax=Pseudogymnoascus verrucosus TaxID=342668 RepID=A0A1B8GW59_9PEZI|nr:uncharacterized protein VE01_01811 [Pseudogymnoascus verrucosus]OBU00083.1 hypothetical protein VE01_01811 [Pseudogymnoascus verrucosus]